MAQETKTKNTKEIIRQPIVTVLGHVDHGKTTLLDTIRHSSVTEREAGKITQAIGASIIPAETINRICGNLLKKLGLTLVIPGLLFIDTPGHAAFSNLRKRGGNLADIAIVVVDINEGFKPQTIEAIEILKNSKTPFIIAANKIDMISGWKTQSPALLENISKQGVSTQELIEKKMYELVGRLYELGFESERFDRVGDYTKQVAIVPVSAKAGDGLPELLMVLAGLTQKYLSNNLKCDVSKSAKGSILEVKEELGLGKTVDVIIYEGFIKVNDTIIIGGLETPIVTKVRALLEPAPLSEMRDKKSKFKNVKQVCAATGVKIAAPELDKAIAGMPLCVLGKEDSLEETKQKIQEEIQQVIIETDNEGIIIKADALGSLEALIILLREKKIPIRKAQIGNVTKKDIIEAEANSKPELKVVMGFNVELNSDAQVHLQETSVKKETAVKNLMSKVIYQLIEEYELWKGNEKKRIEKEGLDKLTRGGKFQILPNHTFRQLNPAIVGVEVLSGLIRVNVPLMKPDGIVITKVKSMKSGKDNVSETKRGEQLAVAMDGVTVGRQIHERDILYVSITEEEFRKLKSYKEYLSPDEKEVLNEIAEIMRKSNPVWGV
ncbi:translation initiation factor IF-2 [Candidatus Woesearchaeota archaeon]|nr:translation initiation factor IF-2 [Candidatus Woesearchaeota archaeon]